MVVAVGCDGFVFVIIGGCAVDGTDFGLVMDSDRFDNAGLGLQSSTVIKADFTRPIEILFVVLANLAMT